MGNAPGQALYRLGKKNPAAKRPRDFEMMSSVSTLEPNRKAAIQGGPQRIVPRSTERVAFRFAVRPRWILVSDIGGTNSNSGVVVDRVAGVQIQRGVRIYLGNNPVQLVDAVDVVNPCSNAVTVVVPVEAGLSTPLGSTVRTSFLEEPCG